MEKINTCYRAILWVNLLTSLVACSHHSKNYMMLGTSSSREAVDNQSDKPGKKLKAPEWDPLLAEVNRLIQEFTECVRYIHGHKDNYTFNNIARVNQEFHNKQGQDNQQHHPLMCYNQIASAVDGTRISKDKLQQLQKCPAPSSTLSSTFTHICYLKYWQEAAAERLTQLRNNLNDPRLDSPFTETFFNQVASYLYRDLLPYWGRVVTLFIFYALNTSVAQGKIDCKAAKAKYKAACKHIESVYGVDHIQAFGDFFKAESHKAVQYTRAKHRNRVGKNHYNPKEIFEKLEKFDVQPIKEMDTTLSTFIDNIEYSGPSKLKEKVMGSLKMYYNIAYSFGIIDLICHFYGIVSIYNSGINIKNSPNKYYCLEVNNFLKEKSIEDVKSLGDQLYLAAFIQGGNDTSLGQVNENFNRIANLAIGLLRKDEEGNVNKCIDQPTNLSCNHKKSSSPKSHSCRG